MTTVCVLGIDPGLSGAAAVVLAGDDGEVGVVGVASWARVRKHPDLRWYHQIFTIIQEITQGAGGYKFDASAVELVGARPGQGVSSMFRFGAATGAALTIARVLTPPGRPVLLVSPLEWNSFRRQRGSLPFGNRQMTDHEEAAAWIAATAANWLLQGRLL